MKTLAIIFLSAVITDNYVLFKFLGICPFLGVGGKTKPAVGMGISVTIVMAIATAITHPIQKLLLEPDYIYLQTVVFILLIASIVQLIEIIMKKFMPSLHQSLGIYLPLITTNCAILGVTILNIDEGYTWVQSMVNSIGAGIGFLLAMVIFASVRERMELRTEPPKAFEGIPLTLVAAAILSLAFMGFSGVIENIFA